jgi:hypothetical protein
LQNLAQQPHSLTAFFTPIFARFSFMHSMQVLKPNVAKKLVDDEFDELDDNGAASTVVEMLIETFDFKVNISK